MSEQVKRYVLCRSGVVSPSIPWESEGGVEHRDMVLASDYDRVESDRAIHAESARGHIAENIRLRGRIDALEGGDRQMAECCEHYEAKNTALDAALTEVCDERDKYHEDYMRLKARLTTAEKLLQEWLDNIGACTCDEAYTRRGLKDPNCRRCDVAFIFEPTAAFLKRSE